MSYRVRFAFDPCDPEDHAPDRRRQKNQRLILSEKDAEGNETELVTVEVDYLPAGTIGDVCAALAGGGCLLTQQTRFDLAADARVRLTARAQFRTVVEGNAAKDPPQH
jgi:hypothetical protein